MQHARDIVEKLLDHPRCPWNLKPKLCSDVAHWARQNGFEVRNLLPPKFDEFCLIAKDVPKATDALEFHKTELQLPQSLTVISKARVRDSVGLVFLPDGSVCEQGTWFPKYLNEHPAFRARFRKANFIDGDINSLLGMFSECFYHWFHDTLPRLISCLPQLPKDTRFLIHKHPRQYQLDSLAALGIGYDRLIQQPNRYDTHIEALWFSTPIGNCLFSDSHTLQTLAATI